MDREYSTSSSSRVGLFLFSLTFGGFSLYSLYINRVIPAIVLGVVSVPFLIFSTMMRGREIFLLDDRIEHKDIFGTTSVRYGGISKVILGGSTVDAIQVYEVDRLLYPDLSVPYAIGDHEELARELLERIPPEVEVDDWMGITDEVEQGAKWNEESVGEA